MLNKNNADWLPSIPWLKLDFVCRLQTEARFSVYKGSMLRGALGSSLRKGLCMTRQKDCATCILNSHCLFPRLFNPVAVDDKAAAAPFCLEPTLEAKSRYKAGDSFDFSLKLFGGAVEYLPFFIQAFRMAGEKGLGAPELPGKFSIESVTSQGHAIYDPVMDELKMPTPQRLPDCSKTFAPSSRLLIRLLTPLRHKNANQFSARLEFGDLFHLILRRLKTLGRIAGSEWRLEPDHYALLNAAAASIATEENSLIWRDWKRYSSRQGSYMLFGGLVDSIIYAGDFSNFHCLLQFAKAAHIGKQTSFGLGQLDFEWL